MNKSFTLFAALPLFLILITLILAIIFLPSLNLDIRNRAADPNTFNQSLTTPPPTPTLSPNTTSSLVDNLGCTSLYQPVCGIDNVTYNSLCEASMTGVQVIYHSPCLPHPNPATSTSSLY